MSSLHLFLVLLCLASVLTTTRSTSLDEEPVCRAGDRSCFTDSTTIDAGTVGSLRPFHLGGPVVFSDFLSNSSLTLQNGMELEVAQGSVSQINQAHFLQGQDTSAYSTEFSVLSHALSKSSVNSLLNILSEYQYFDEDPDTVDGMPTYEIFVDSPDLGSPSNKVRDSDPNFLPYRTKMRQQLQNILQPYLKNVITPYIQQHIPACKNKGSARACTPCYSLIRRYRHGDRVSHGTHHDGHAIVTAVVSLSDYNTEYRGGLYVSTGYGQREFLALNKGDAVVHQSTLLHGVQVYDKLDTPQDTHRWSWILWYRDSTQCQDYSYEWFADCANQGNPLCQQLHSTKVGALPTMPKHEVADTILDLNKKAAQGGAGMAAVKVARAYLNQLPSSLSFDLEQAATYYQLAMQSHNPDGHYGMATILLQTVTFEQQQNLGNKDNYNYNTDPRVIKAVQHLGSAAQLHHAYSQFNLGMVHTYGYATNVINGTVAAMWFEESGLPEGYYLAAQQAKAIGNQERYKVLGARAQALGFTATWRRQAREVTGSGGASGVSLNMPWPTANDGRKPPKV